MLFGAFVKMTRRKRGDKTYTYLSLVEAGRVEGKVVHHTLLRLGEVTALRNSGQLADRTDERDSCQCRGGPDKGGFPPRTTLRESSGRARLVVAFAGDDGRSLHQRGAPFKGLRCPLASG